MGMIMSNLVVIKRLLRLIVDMKFVYFCDFVDYLFSAENENMSDYAIAIEYADFFDKYIASHCQKERGVVNGEASCGEEKACDYT